MRSTRSFHFSESFHFSQVSFCIKFVILNCINFQFFFTRISTVSSSAPKEKKTDLGKRFQYASGHSDRAKIGFGCARVVALVGKSGLGKGWVRGNRQFTNAGSHAGLVIQATT